MRVLVAAVLLAVLVLSGNPGPLAAAEGPAPVQVTPMGPIQPDAAPTQSLYLTRYVIAPQTRLAVHRHEGTQIGAIISGLLTYSVVHGAVPVFRTGPDGKPQQIDTVTSGQRRVITPGQWVVETADDVHYAANLGSEPVTIFTSSLLRKGAPLATPVDQ